VGLDEDDFDDKDVQELLGVFDEVKLGLEDDSEDSDEDSGEEQSGEDEEEGEEEQDNDQCE